MTEEDRKARYLRHRDTGWIGVDLDGTLAYYDKWGAPLEFGEPIPRMVERVREWISWGMTVKVVTARMPLPDDFLARSDEGGYLWDQHDMRTAIGLWTEKHIGLRLDAVCYKDLHMIELWDDRAVQVVANTGRTLAEEHAAELAALRGAP